MTTPEGKIKRKVNQALKEFGDHVWKFMPVQASAFGMPALDYLLCVNKRFVAIETKAPNKEPTKRQLQTIDAICKAGGVVFIVDDEASLQQMMVVLRGFTNLDQTQENPPTSRRGDRAIIFD